MVAVQVTNPSKKKGTFHETQSVIWLRRNGWVFAKRITQKGNKDEGDIVLGDGIPVAIEAKNEKAISLATYIRELENEIAASGAETGVVIIKRRGTTDVSRYYALTTVGMWNDLTRQVYKVSYPKRRIVRVA